MTSDSATATEQLSREEWRRIPHDYACAYPQYTCAKCGLWPGAQIHEAPPAEARRQT